MDSYDFDIYKGSTFSLGISLKDGDSNPIDLTNYSISGFLKFKYSDSTKLSSLNPERVAPYESGSINLSIPASGTSLLPISLLVYDIELHHITSGTVDKILNGKVSVYPEVSD